MYEQNTGLDGIAHNYPPTDTAIRGTVSVLIRRQNGDTTDLNPGLTVDLLRVAGPKPDQHALERKECLLRLTPVDHKLSSGERGVLGVSS